MTNMHKLDKEWVAYWVDQTNYLAIKAPTKKKAQTLISLVVNAFKQKGKHKNYPYRKVSNGLKQIELGQFQGESYQLTALRRAAYAYEIAH